MSHVTILRRLRGPDSLGEELACLLAGASFTLLLFLGLARFETPGTLVPPAPIEDLRAVAIPLEPPPPPARMELTEPTEPAAGLAGLEISAAESPVRIAVVPPDLAALFPPTEVAPPAQIQVGQLIPELKPRITTEADFRQVFQQSDVDRIPTVLFRAVPRIPSWVRRNAQVLRVTLLLVVNEKGFVTSIRLLKPSGNPEFDEIVSECVKEEWVFTPAVKAGRKVKCLLQQAVTMRWERGSHFEA